MYNIWQKEITYLKKVGPKRAEVLASQCQIRTYADLLVYFPRKYLDRSKVGKIGSLTGDEGFTTLLGKILDAELVKGQKGRNRLVAHFSDGSGVAELIWFQGASWIKKNLVIGEEVALFGRPGRYGKKIQFTHPEIDQIKEKGKNGEDEQQFLPIIPAYPSNEKLGRLGLDSRGFRTIMTKLLEETERMIPETLSKDIIEQNQLISRREAIKHIHFPPSFVALKAAQRRLKFEEFFYFQLMLARRRKHAKVMNQSNPFRKIGPYFNQFFENHMPFDLTGAQKRVLKEIRKDLGQPIQMNRLVQGDVGSGKTMVAFMSMLICKDNGFQSAIMAPTAILAEQHYKKITRMAEKVGITTNLLVGGQRKKERTQILEDIASGATDIAIGTHALIEDTVQFHKLGMVVVDEQHKFGVKQRARLWQKAKPFPHNLIMTATPIPRTLAMSLYGDVDVSLIDELPPGRKPIKTVIRGESKRLEVLGFIKEQLSKGMQAYVVYPLVEESEKLDYLAAVKGFELLERYFTGYRVGIVHGRQKAEDKELEMQRFVQNKTQILVSTTVIEVGVDVPNASVMVIENSEKFGLSQLHQLRGRVGRGSDQAYCILMAGKKVSKEGRKRLQAMKDSNDGFVISEVDLEIRGPGDFMGTRQSGLPEFQLANIVEDRDILENARAAAFALAETDPKLEQEGHRVVDFYYKKYLNQYGHLGTLA